MIRHVVVFSWTPEATAEQKQQLADELARLPSLIPEIRAFALGPDVGVNEGNFDFAAVADFDNVDDYIAYRDNPDHREMVATYLRPIVSSRAAVQYAF
jgi:hypothetical protein